MEEDATELNNHYMAALGMGTLVLRLGAVLQLSRKLQQGDDAMDALFIRQVLDNLSEVLPSDSQWRRIWEISTDPEDAWHDPVARPRGGQSLLERFVTFRNRFVHGRIRLVEDHATKLAQAGTMFEEMRALAGRLEEGGLALSDGRYTWKQGVKPCPCTPSSNRANRRVSLVSSKASMGRVRNAMPPCSPSPVAQRFTSRERSISRSGLSRCGNRFGVVRASCSTTASASSTTSNASSDGSGSAGPSWIGRWFRRAIRCSRYTHPRAWERGLSLPMPSSSWRNTRWTGSGHPFRSSTISAEVAS